ncbi:MAG: hypothetical protein VXZ82_24605 [Planctomycetota bacterium]|nr:hypothetical protein [Planctomycetota bacterium]
MNDLWVFTWLGVMLVLIIAMTVAAVRESSARKKAMTGMQPQPLDAGMAEPVADAGLGEATEGEFASLEDETLK